MSYLPKLWTDISARLEADTTLMAALPSGSGILNSRSFDNSPLPVIVYNVVSDTSDDAFRLSHRIVSFDVHVYVERSASASPNVAGQVDGFTVAGTLIGRIDGDWTAQTFGTGPTYGLDRWRPSLTDSGFAATVCVKKSSREMHDDETLHWVLEYEVRISKVAS